MHTSARALTLAALALVGAILAGCGGAPPSSELNAAIEREVRDTRPDLLDTSAASAEVRSIKVTELKKVKSETRANAGYPVYSGEWAAKLRFKEPYGWVVVELDGTRVVRTVAKAGDEIEYRGKLHARKDEDDGKWHVTAWHAGEPLEKLWSQIADSGGTAPIFSYPSVKGLSQTNSPRGIGFQPHSKLKPLVEENSKEMEELAARVAESRRNAQEEAAERQRQIQEQRALEQQRRQEEYAAQQLHQQEEAAERRRIAAEEAAERRRVAEEEAKRQAEAQRVARLRPMFQPLGWPTGVGITTDAGLTMGTVIIKAELDEGAFTATGTAIDLRQMPFREAPFEAAVSDRAVLSLSSSLTPEPLRFTRATPSGLTGGGIALNTLGESERAQLDEIVRLGKRLAEVTPLDLPVETLDAEGAKNREMDLRGVAIPGTVLFRGRIAPTVAPMFAAESAASRSYSWRSETVSVRLAEPVRGKALFIRGGTGATDNLLVVINGVHRARIEAMARAGAAVVTLPPELEILDIRLEAIGSATSRGILLVQ